MALSQQDIEFFLNQARIKLPGASDAGIKTELFAVIKEFLQDSNSWIEYSQLLVTAGVQQYLISPRDGGQIIRLVGVRDGNRVPVNASMPTLGELTVFQPINISSIAASPPVTTTASNYPWTVCVVKNITLPQTREQLPIAPAFLLNVYSGTILDGVLGKMMMEQAKSYSNGPVGMYHLRRFRDGIGVARTDVWNQNLLGGQRWAFPQQFSTNSQRGSGVVWPGETF